MRCLVIIINLTVLLTACAAVEPQPDVDQQAPRRLPTDAEVEQYNAQVDPDDRIVCRRETKVGTNIPRRVCRLVRDVRETSAFHREQLQRALR